MNIQNPTQIYYHDVNISFNLNVEFILLFYSLICSHDIRSNLRFENDPDLIEQLA